MLLYVLLFFFYRYGPHRHLHSFPTRRSSDLLVARVARRDVPVCVRGESGTSPPAWPPSWASRCRRRRRKSRPSSCACCATRSEEHTLNSSHSQISYAVFCLKKKKKSKLLHVA